MIRFVFGAFACVVACECIHIQAAERFLVQDGQPHAEIVIAEQPTRMQKLAADELQTYVEKISGAKLPIVTSPSGSDLAAIYVGKSSHTDMLKITTDDLAHGAFRLASGDNWLALVGDDADFTPREPFARHNGDLPRATAEWDKRTGAKWGFPHTQIYKGYNSTLKIWELDEHGSLNAVNELLRRLGVRWFIPGELGEVVPRQATIKLPSLNETVRPDFALRYPYQYFKRFGMASVDETMWQLRLGLHQGPDIVGYGDIGHGTRTVHEREEVRKAHPEYFALFGGKRESDGSFGSGKPCLSSPGLFDENVRYVRAMFDIYGEQSVSVMPEDGYVALCQCELCKGKGTPERGWNGQISDYVWDYVDRVGREVYKTHPDRKIHCLAYGGYQAPPLKIEKFSPNVVVGIAQARAGFHDPAERKVYEDLRKAWRAKSSHPLYVWDYYLQSRVGHVYEFMPTFFPRQVATDLKALKGISSGDFIEVYRTADNLKDFAAGHLNLYVTARYWWDADQNIDALLDDFFTNYFGPANEEARAFVTFAEAHWMRLREQPEQIDQAFALLDKVRAKAPADSIYARRVALIADYMAPMKNLREQLARKRENVPHLQILPNEGPPIVVDGKLDDELWQRPSGLGFAELETGRQPVFGGSVKAAWQKDSLVLGITCRDRDTDRLALTTKVHDDSTIWNGDVVELLIETQVHSYYQIAINPNGTVTDLDRKRGLNTLWKSGVQVATHRGEGFWTIELRLPVADESQAVLNPLDGVAGRPPSKTYPWYFNICRQRIGAHGVELSAVSPTGTDHFHVLDRFAILNLKAGGLKQDNPSLNPNFRQGYVLQRQDALALVAAGKQQDALDAFKRLAGGPATDLQQADALEQASQCALRLKRVDEALALAKQIRLAPYAKLAQMRILESSQRWKDFTDQFGSEDLDHWPDTIAGDGAAERGTVWFFLKDGVRAERDLQKALSFVTDYNTKGNCLNMLGDTYRLLLKDDAKALATYRQVYATANNYKHCYAAVQIAQILQGQKKYDEAIAELDRIDLSQVTIEYYRSMMLKAKANAAKRGGGD